MNDSSTLSRPVATLPVATRGSEDLPYQDFVEQYVLTGTPVVVNRAFSDWPAMRKWTPAFFKERFSDRLVNVSYREKLPFAEFIDRAEASTAEKPGPYMYRLFLHEQLPEVLPDVSPQCRYAFPRRFASPLMPRYWRRPDGYQKLLIGGVGGQFPVMHFDGENVHATISQIYGEKEFILFAPGDTPYLYPRPDQPNQSLVPDPLHPDAEMFPLLEKATCYRTVLRPGDMVFVPNGWWHTARALSMSISIGMNMLERSNWAGFVREVTYGQTGGRAMLKRQYLSGLGGVLSAIETAQRLVPGMANALKLTELAPVTAVGIPDPALRPLRIELPTA